MSTIPRLQQAVSVLWPSFLIAGMATVVFFTAFDPQVIGECLGPRNVSRVGTYTVGFFLFWLMTVSSSLLTVYFRQPCHTPVQLPTRDADDGSSVL